MRIRLFVIASLLLLVAAPAFAQDDAVPRFEAGDCPFSVSEDQTVECGFVVVPEDRSDPDNTNTLRLAVAVFRAGEDAQPDPVVMLSGGPGEKTLANGGLVAGAFSAIVPDRDFIIFDQRGVGLSEPALECPEWNESILASLNELDAEVSAKSTYDALVACRERLVSEGYNLDAFDTVQNAADVNDLRLALGYEQLNLMGISYGSVLAQSVIRDFPEAVRSAIIDSVLPLDESFFLNNYTTVTDALDRLIEACAADEACNTAYPDLRNVLFEVIERLNDEPVDVTLRNPMTGDTVPIKLTGDAVVGNLAFFLYQAPILPQMPQAIYNVYNGDYELMTQLSGLVLIAFDALSRGMEYSVFCADDLLERGEEQLAEVISGLPEAYQGRTDLETQLAYSPFDVCEAWGVETSDPSVKEPVVSDIPVLVLAGEFDPVTPPSYARRVAETLSSSFVYEFPGIGHSVIASSECARTITLAFLDDPATEPDASCLDEMTGVEFAVPSGEPDVITLVEFSGEELGFSGVQPEGWTTFVPGIVARASNPADQTALVQQIVSDVTLDQFLELARQQLGADAPPEPVSTREANGLTWQLYEVESQGLPTDMALAEGDGVVYTVQLVSGSPEDRAVLYETVFLPAVDAFTPLS